VSSTHCQNCGAPLPPDAVWAGRCPACSAMLAGETAASPSPTTDQSSAAGKNASADAAWTLQEGERFAGLTIEKVQGSGGFGTVYRAHDDKGDLLALKVANRGQHLLPTDRMVFVQNELEALTRLRHPSLVEVRSAGFSEKEGTSGSFYIAMEFVEGTTLDSFIRERGRVDALESIGLVREIAATLAYCHEAGVLHLDLKPANVMIVDVHTPLIKILDFGIAVLHEGWDRGGAHTAGSAGYSAPECFMPEREKKIGARSDLYSLGVIWYALLTGALPFPGQSAAELLQQQLRGSVVPLTQRLPSVPPQVAKLVHALIRLDPAERYPSAADLCRDLRALYYSILRSDAAARPAPQQPIESVEIASPAPGEAPLVGREEELSLLRERFQHALAERQPVCVVVTGEAGIGKSRLLAEFLRREGRSTLRVALGYGRCREGGGLIPYAPLRAAMRSLTSVLQAGRHSSSEARAAIAAAVAQDREVLGGLVPELLDVAPAAGDPALSPLVGARRVAGAIGGLLSKLSRVVNIIFCIEDLHWADDGTIAVLRELAKLRDLGPVFLLGSTRQLRNDPPDEGIEVVALPNFDEDATEKMLRGLAGNLDDETLAQLKRSVPLLGKGNPFILTRVVPHLRREGLLVRDASGRMTLSQTLGSGYEPPDSVASMLMRDLDHLAEGLRVILRVAALMGRTFHASDLAELGRFDRADVQRAIDWAVHTRLCRIDGDTCTFTHDSIREHLVSSLAPEARPEAHRGIAEILHKRGGAPGTLAYHLERAGEPLAAARNYYESALEADRLHDPMGSSSQLERAIQLLNQARGTSPEVPHLLLRAVHELGRVSSFMGTAGRTLGLLDECSQSVQGLDPVDLLPLHSAYARLYYVQGDFPNAVARSKQALQTTRTDEETRAFLCAPANIVGRALCASGRFGPSIPVLEKGCAAARDAKEYVELSHSEGLLGVALAFGGRFADARPRMESAEEVARRLADPVRAMGAWFYWTTLAECEAKWQAGLQAAADLLAFAEREKLSGPYFYLGTMFAGRHSYHGGSLERARMLLRNALNIAGRLRMRLGIGWGHAFLGDVLFVGGDRERAADHYKRGLEIGNEGGGDEYAAPMCLAGLAHCAATVHNDREGAHKLADESLRRFAAAGNETARLHALQRFAEAFALLGETAEAEQYREQHRLGTEKLGISGEWRPRDLSGGGLAEMTPATIPDQVVIGSATTLARAEPAVTQSSVVDSLSSVDGFIPAFVPIP
jgi:eukaryotic-like serine/threonine-protein kinase